MLIQLCRTCLSGDEDAVAESELEVGTVEPEEVDVVVALREAMDHRGAVLPLQVADNLSLREL